ncbi:MAG: hypothetical protein IPN67_18030 [Bacteroidales bacterium]|nr:hypothetical protein [Bacteroidales bacterium]
MTIQALPFRSAAVTFPAGSASGATQTISIPVTDDAVTEPTETFDVNLTNVLSTGTATITDGLGVGTINHNDASSVAIDDVLLMIRAAAVGVHSDPYRRCTGCTYCRLYNQ